MRVRGKKLLAAMLSLAMVLSMFVVPAAARGEDVTYPEWTFINDGNAAGTDYTTLSLDGLTITGLAEKNGDTHGLKTAETTFTATVPGPCTVTVTVSNSWLVWMEEDAVHKDFDSCYSHQKDSNNKELVFNYTGEAGEVHIHTPNQVANSYIVSIKTSAPAENPTLSLNKSSVVVKMGETATVTPTVTNGTAGTYTFEYADAGIVTAEEEGGTITLTPVAAGKTTVTVKTTADGTDLSETVAVRVLPAQVGTVTENTTYNFEVKGNNPGEDNYYAEGLEWSGLALGNGKDHGPTGGNGAKMTVNVPAGKQTTLKVTTCKYGNGVTPTVKNGTLDTDATENSSEGADGTTYGQVFTINNAKGAVEITFGSSVYVHSLEVGAFTDATTEPDPGPSGDFEGKTWIFTNTTTLTNQTEFDGLTLSGVEDETHNGKAHAILRNGSKIIVPVTGKCTVVVTAYYQASATVGTTPIEVVAGSTSKTVESPYSYTSETAGTVEIAATGTTYITKIEIKEYTEPKPFLILDKKSVTLKMGETTTDKVTATVGNSDAAVEAESKDTSVATAAVNGKEITITAAGAGTTTVEVTVAGVKKTVDVTVEAAGEITYDKWDFTAASYQSHTADGTAENPDVYQTLSIVGGHYKDTTYGMQITNGTVSIPVTGKCDINIALGYRWDIQLDGDPESRLLKDSGDNGKGVPFTFRYTGEAGTAVLKIGSTTTYIKSIELKPVVDAADRKIDVWDLGGKVETSDDARYRFNVTPADWVSAGTVSGGLFTANGDTTFGDLTITAKGKDRLYSTETSNAAFAAIVNGDGNTYADAFDDGYKAVGAYYCNGAGDSSNRLLTLTGVSAGDKIVAYLGSSNSTVTFHFQGVKQDDVITRDKGVSEVAEFTAQENGTYKIWSTSGKPLYYRVVRFPGVAVSGSITLPAEFTATDYTVKFVNQANKQETAAVVDTTAKTYTATLAPGFTYTVTLSGATGWGFNAATRTLETTEAESMGEKIANLVVEAKPVCTYAGTITGFAADFDFTGVAITLVPTDPTAADPVALTINPDKTFTATVDSGMAYTLKMEGANDYSITAPAEVKLTANAADQTITVAAKGLQAASGKFIGLGEGVEVTALKFKNVEDNYEYAATIANGGYTANLRAGAYAAVATVAGYTTKTHVVVTEGKDTVKDLLFVSSAAKPAVAKVADVYVDPAKTGEANTYATMRDAVDAVSRMGISSEADRVTIHIAPGTYREQVIIKTPYITLTNDDAGEVLLTWYYGIGYKYYSSGNGYYDAEQAFDKYEKAIADRWGTAVRVEKTATGFRAEGIAFENSFNRYVTDKEIADGVELVENPENSTVVRAKGVDVTSKAATERAAAICVETDQAEFFNCSFLSSQDTVYTAGDKNGCKGRMYFKDCYIEGQTDYIFGSGSVVFDNCTLNWKGYSETNKTYPGYITAVRPDDTTGCKGYLFRDCTVTANPSLTVAPGYWGRTWGANAMVTLLNTKLEKADLILDAGWTSMNGDPKNANYHEFGTTTLAGAAVDTSKRTAGTVMTEAEADAVKAEDYFDSWTPYYYGMDTRTVTFKVGTGASVTDLAADGEPKALDRNSRLVALKEAIITFKIALTEGYTLNSVTGATWDDDSVYTVTADTVVISASRPSSGSSDMLPTGPMGGNKGETVTNPDGSKTTTKTDKNGTTTVTTVATDGSKLETVTTKAGDKTITVTDAKGEVQVKIELPATIPAPETKFTDVPESHWAESAINDMAGLGLVKGVNEDSFDMVSPITRASVATILFRLSNGAEGKTSSFTDVPAGEWYADAVAWAASTGVVNGYSETVFAPNDSITREQFAVMLYRFAKLIGMDTAASGDVSKFGDAASVSEWATDAMAWCVGEGILNGTNDPVQGIALSPAKTASRAECAVMLDRFIALI